MVKLLQQYARKKKTTKETAVKWYFRNEIKDIGDNNNSYINSSPPGAAYMRQWIRSALVQIMACRLLGAKPLSNAMLGYY